MIEVTLHEGRSASDEDEKNDKDQGHQKRLNIAGLLDPGEIEKQQPCSHADSHHHWVQVGEETQVDAQSNESERRLEHKGEPDTDPGDGAHQWTHGEIDVQIGAARSGHGGCHLRLGKGRGEHDHSCQRVGDDHAGTPNLEGQARQNEDPRSDHGPDGHGEHGV